jgi:hypothetical protein
LPNEVKLTQTGNARFDQRGLLLIDLAIVYQGIATSGESPCGDKCAGTTNPCAPLLN